LKSDLVIARQHFGFFTTLGNKPTLGSLMIWRTASYAIRTRREEAEATLRVAQQRAPITRAQRQFEQDWRLGREQDWRLDRSSGSARL
jgi:hypothetical protein